MRALTVDYKLTRHARWRMAQRNISYESIWLVIQHGRREYRGGAELYFMGKRCIPRGVPHPERLEGIVVLCQGSYITTVYRNRKRGLKDHRRKAKYDCKKAKLTALRAEDDDPAEGANAAITIADEA